MGVLCGEGGVVEFVVVLGSLSFEIVIVWVWVWMSDGGSLRDVVCGGFL